MGKTKRDNPLKPSRSRLKARKSLWKCVSCSIHFLYNPTFSLNWTEIDVTVWSWRVSEQRITYMHQGKEENIKLKLWAGNITMEAHSRSRNQYHIHIYFAKNMAAFQDLFFQDLQSCHHDCLVKQSCYVGGPNKVLRVFL